VIIVDTKNYKILRENNSLSNSFYKWFGKSKVIDNSGKPLIVYHESNNKFNIFNLNKISYTSGNYGHYGYGFYFSNDIREAKTYGSNILEVYLRIEKPFYASDQILLKKYAVKYFNYKEKNIAFDKNWLLKQLKRKDNISYILANFLDKYDYSKAWKELFNYLEKNNLNINDAKLDLNNVADWFQATNVNSQESLSDYMIEEVEKELGKAIFVKDVLEHISLHWLTNLGEYSKEFTDIIKKDGYDGVIAGSEYVVFNSYQIKSIDAKEFNLNSDNIYERTK
jgi:hypothetical protein